MRRPELEARSQAFAIDVIALCRVVRKDPDGQQPADQLQDAATSAGSNYRASGRARSRAEFVAKLGIVNEEIDESVYWLELLKRSHMGDSATVNRLLDEASELRAIFASSYRTARRGRRS
jgi:four helix bundle protein